MSEVVRVEVASAAAGKTAEAAGYDVVIGSGILHELGESVRGVSDAESLVLLTDSVVAAGKHAIHAGASLVTAGFQVTDMQVAAGEASKNWDIAGRVLEAVAEVGISRREPIVGVGGGVVGDLAGFVAGVYMRGVPYIAVPTTLLAMVDSSIGGKTGIDLEAGKNLAGVFKQPALVFADIATLATLPEREWKSGLAEVAKSALLGGEGFTGWLEGHAEALSAGPSGAADTGVTGASGAAEVPAAMEEMVRRCVGFKAGVVARDERETGVRECLNYGHTLGHAIEKVAGYGVFSHGEAIAEGMRFAARVAADVSGADVGFVRRLDRLLDLLGIGALDVGGLDTPLSASSLLEAMRADKKAHSGLVRMVLLSAPGVWECAAIPDRVLLAHLQQWAKTKGSAEK
ncbi:MAG: 3-dehydroquinate synthase [Coriobacteriia bacterium]|nr:3-dehydroquinate synthase [Coriobacteriia bacterium]